MTVPPPLEGPSRGERVLWVVVTAGFLLSASGDRLPWLRGPAPYPPEWQWPLREGVVSGPLWPALVAVLAILALLALSGTAWARSRPARAQRVLLALASVLGLALPLALVALEPDGVLPTIFGRVAYRTATSYYTVALSPEAADPLEFLRRHDELLPTFRKGAKHAATHPPGPVLVYRGLIALCDHAPGLTRAVLKLSGLLETNPLRARPEHAASSRAAAVLGGVLILLACVLTAWPVAALARGVGCGPLASARLGLLWTLLPGPVLLLPQFDQALALPVAASAAALASALRAERPRRGAVWAIASGLAGGLAVALSYGAPAFLALGGVAVLAASVAGGVKLTRALRWCALAALVTAGVFAAPALVGHHPIASARAALRIHREFFTQPRDYAVWLVFDPLDLAVFIGLPVAVSLVFAAVRSARRGIARARLQPDEAFRLGALAALLVLLVSGQTRGEVGRIWIPVMPVLLVAALARPRDGNDGAPSAASALLLAATIASTTIAIALWWRFF
ncbi:MAG TPA: hypothetical protein VEQ84_09665 [Vicinamibacteria bacterium]|nr:hypothetical protein [Vicinamibacteria bacterium]